MDKKTEDTAIVPMSSEVLVPREKILVVDGMLHPSAKVFLCCSTEKRLIKPIVTLRIHGRQEDVDLEIPGIGASSINSTLTFAEEVFAAFWDDNGEEDESLALYRIAALSLSKSLRLLKFDLCGCDKEGEYRAAGTCELHLNGIHCAITREIQLDDDLALDMATFFAKLPEHRPKLPVA